MKFFRFVLPFLSFLVLTWLTPTAAFAHTLLSSGSIGLVIHVDPEDDPIVGQPSNFYLEFKDKNNQFALANCVCSVTVTESNKQLYTQTLAQPHHETLSSSFTYTFPEKGVYKLTISGKPSSGSSFTPFSLDFDLRVARGDGAAASNSASVSSRMLGWPLYLGLGLVISLGFLGWRKLKPYQSAIGSGVKKKLPVALLVAALSASLVSLGFNHNHCLDPQDLGGHQSQHECCLPQVAALPLGPNLEEPVVGFSSQLLFNISFVETESSSVLTNKSPPAAASS